MKDDKHAIISRYWGFDAGGKSNIVRLEQAMNEEDVNNPTVHSFKPTNWANYPQSHIDIADVIVPSRFTLKFTLTPHEAAIARLSDYRLYQYMLLHPDVSISIQDFTLPASQVISEVQYIEGINFEVNGQKFTPGIVKNLYESPIVDGAFLDLPNAGHIIDIENFAFDNSLVWHALLKRGMKVIPVESSLNTAVRRQLGPITVNDGPNGQHNQSAISVDDIWNYYMGTKMAIAAIVWPSIVNVLMTCRSKACLDLAFSLFAELTGAPVASDSHYFGGLTTFADIERAAAASGKYSQSSLDIATQVDMALAKTYSIAYNNATTLLQNTTYVDDLFLLNQYLASANSSLLPAPANTVDPNPTKTYALFLRNTTIYSKDAIAQIISSSNSSQALSNYTSQAVRRNSASEFPGRTPNISNLRRRFVCGCRGHVACTLA